jgi:fructose-1,6-bisphosphatase/inositol monophosphatase family enzyme
VPPEHEAGVYAHAAIMWHTASDFAIDFGVYERPEPLDPDDPESPLAARTRAVARVRFPPSFAFDLVRAVSGRIDLYESEWGEIRRPGT